MENYFEKNLLLRQELEFYLRKTYSDTEWLVLNRDFFRERHYFTSHARKRYNEQKNRNLETILNLLARDEANTLSCGRIGLM